VIPVLDASADDAMTVAETLTSAFLDADPLAGWLISDRAQRGRIFYRYFERLAEHALAHGIVRVSPGYEAVALSFARAQPAATDHDNSTVDEICGPHAPRFRLLQQARCDAHPRTRHEYLSYVAVRPEHHHRGFGTALLYDRLRTCQFFYLPIYAEAPSPRHRAWYQRLGFTPHGPAILLPNGPQLHPLWWQPLLPDTGDP
jgi:ribosomal protein S18 acetylase RimI-like enzyme